MKRLSAIMMGLSLLGWSGVSYGQSLNAPVTTQYVDHLNSHFPDLNLKALSQGPKAYHQLEQLENLLNPTLEVLRNTGGQNPWLPNGSLSELSCSKTVCGNGGGPCRTCFVEPR